MPFDGFHDSMLDLRFFITFFFFWWRNWDAAEVAILFLFLEYGWKESKGGRRTGRSGWCQRLRRETWQGRWQRIDFGTKRIPEVSWVTQVMINVHLPWLQGSLQHEMTMDSLLRHGSFGRKLKLLSSCYYHSWYDHDNRYTKRAMILYHHHCNARGGQG